MYPWSFKITISSTLNIEDIRATSLIKYDLSVEVCGISKIESGKHMAKCFIRTFSAKFVFVKFFIKRSSCCFCLIYWLLDSFYSSWSYYEAILSIIDVLYLLSDFDYFLWCFFVFFFFFRSSPIFFTWVGSS